MARIDRLEQALVTFASTAGAPDQYRQVLIDLQVEVPAPVNRGGGFQQVVR
jgi:hypothetical protein